MADRQKPMGMDRALTSKMGAKWDPAAEAEARGWIQDLIGEDIGDGPTNIEKNLRNGVILMQLMKKIYDGTPQLPDRAKNVKLGINKSPAPFAMMENIENFLKAAKAYGVKDNSCFNTGDLYEARNMPMVISTILQVGSEAQRNSFDGPTAGPKPMVSHKPPSKFTYEQLKSGHGIITLQAGTNKLASQKGMTSMGAQRHIADIRADQFDKSSETVVSLQCGTNKWASQKGMTAIGAVRHICDIRADDASAEGKAVLNLQNGTNQWASQKGMTGFGAIRHVKDIKADDLSIEGAAVLRPDMGYADGASQKGMTSFGSIRHVSDIRIADLAEEKRLSGAVTPIQQPVEQEQPQTEELEQLE